MLTLLIALVMHPVHASLSEVQWNDQTRGLEVSLRLSPEDAHWITQTSPELPDLGKEEFPESDGSDPPEKARRALRYLSHHFVTRPHVRDEKHLAAGTSNPMRSEASSSQDTYRWIGEESRSGYVWWHFEILPFDKVPPQKFLITMLLDRAENYQHRVVILGLEHPASLDFTSSNPQQEAAFWKR